MYISESWVAMSYSNQLLTLSFYEYPPLITFFPTHVENHHGRHQF